MIPSTGKKLENVKIKHCDISTFGMDADDRAW